MSTEKNLTTIEKVIFLKSVDIFEHALMSVRRNAPYRDRLEDGGTSSSTRAHDQQKGPRYPNPKVVDQSKRFPSGRLTQNGKFHDPAQLHKFGKRPPERVRVHEKIQTGIWSYNGIFHLIESSRMREGADVQFIENDLFARDAAPSLIGPCEVLGKHDGRWLMDAVGLPERSRVGPQWAAVEPIGVAPLPAPPAPRQRNVLRRRRATWQSPAATGTPSHRC